MTEKRSDSIADQACLFVCQHRSLMLATLLTKSTNVDAATDDEVMPHVSHVPFAPGASGELLIIVSELSAHTKALLGNGYVSAMVIENEVTDIGDSGKTDESADSFARARLMLDGQAQRIEKDSESYINGTQLLRQRLGETVDILTQLPDFHLIALTITSGTFIRGFAQAHPLKESLVQGILKRAYLEMVSE